MGSLLEFVCLLLEREAMPAFDPDSTTTNEVAYSVIVPQSEGGAYARLMTCGEPCFPRCLITHTWSNVFTHTVAAAVADALEIPYYYHLLHRLRTLEDVRALMKQLETRRRMITLGGGKQSEDSVLMRTYWLCAMSIDQHKVACHVARRCDKGHCLSFMKAGTPPAPCTSTKCRGASGDVRFACKLCGVAICQACAMVAPQVCTCTKPKIGAGLATCEVDKFDDMMAFLRKFWATASGTDFYHVVALDKDSVALTRTWVVAELAEGQRSGLLQFIKVYFPIALASDDLAEHALRVDVRNCEAANPADSEMILAKIKDKDAYNEQVRQKLRDTIKQGLASTIGFVILYVTSVLFTAAIIVQTWTQWEAIACCSRDGLLATARVLWIPVKYVPDIVFISLLSASHMKYRCIVDAVHASRGFRALVLHEATVLRGTRGFDTLWKLQKWYARQSILRDTLDEDSDSDAARQHAAVTRSSRSGRRCLVDVLMLGCQRVMTWSMLTAGLYAFIDRIGFWVTVSSCCGIVGAAFFFAYDPDVRERNWRGAVLSVILLDGFLGPLLNGRHWIAILKYTVAVCCMMLLLSGDSIDRRCKQSAKREVDQPSTSKMAGKSCGLE